MSRSGGCRTLVEQTQGDEFGQSVRQPGKTFSAIDMDVDVSLAVAGLGAQPPPRGSATSMFRTALDHPRSVITQVIRRGHAYHSLRAPADADRIGTSDPPTRTTYAARNRSRERSDPRHTSGELL
jgi:hypothetical protein